MAPTKSRGVTCLRQSEVIVDSVGTGRGSAKGREKNRGLRRSMGKGAGGTKMVRGWWKKDRNVGLREGAATKY